MPHFKYSALGTVLSVGALIYCVPLIIGSLTKKESSPKIACQSNLKLIGLALIQYTQDYDGTMPRAKGRGKGSPYGWADALAPYLYSTQAYQCPSEATAWSKLPSDAIGYTDYWYNARLSGESTVSTNYAASVLLAGEGNDGTDATDARYAIPTLPTKWIKSISSPLYRHYGSANYLFADGHVKAFSPENTRRLLFAPSIKSTRPQKN